jgi:hypothetical protein
MSPRFPRENRTKNIFLNGTAIALYRGRRKNLRKKEKEMYNGYKNYETWNVVLWISNDEGLYTLAKCCPSYEYFVDCLKGFNNLETPDNVAWDDENLDVERLNDFWFESFSNVEA